MKALRYFGCIVGAALVSAALGGLFGAVVAWVSPEFAQSLLSPRCDCISRYAAAVGMIWGLFLGAGCMGFALAIASAVAIFGRRKNGADCSGQAG